jgi:hypothetical protein
MQHHFPDLKTEERKTLGGKADIGWPNQPPRLSQNLILGLMIGFFFVAK